MFVQSDVAIGTTGPDIPMQPDPKAQQDSACCINPCVCVYLTNTLANPTFHPFLATTQMQGLLTPSLPLSVLFTVHLSSSPCALTIDFL
jgi:hypothetical protein